MNIINSILNTAPYQLPPVKRDKNGFHSLDVSYRDAQFQDADVSLRELLERYLFWIIEQNNRLDAEMLPEEE